MFLPEGKGIEEEKLTGSDDQESRPGFWITRPRSGKGFELCLFNLRPCPQKHSGGWEDETVDIKVSGTTKQVWLLDSRWFHSWNWIFWPLDLLVGPGNSKARSRPRCLFAVFPQTIILYKVIAQKINLKYILSNSSLTFYSENHHISWEQKEIEQVMSTKLLLFPKFQSIVAILNFIEMKNEVTLPLFPFLVKKIMNLFCLRKENIGFGP